ncbi:MAG: hypothetical protein AB7F75_03500, partial [Planctomycetota bacterium]
DNSILSRGGESVVATGIPLEPYYLQTDTAWKLETVGGSGELLSDVGCTLCCVSMAATQLGISMDPKQLNRELKAQGGYTRNGLLKWDIAEKVLKNAIAFEILEIPSYSSIDSAVRAGNPVVTKILIGGAIPHWVLLVGKDGDDYLVKNPLCQQKVIERLSTLSKKILSIRIAKRNN